MKKLTKAERKIVERFYAGESVHYLGWDRIGQGLGKDSDAEIVFVEDAIRKYLRSAR